MQGEYDELQKQYVAESVQLQLRFRESYLPLLCKRREIVAGTVSPQEVLAAAAAAAAAATDAAAAPAAASGADAPAAAVAAAGAAGEGIPGFWLQAMKNCSVRMVQRHAAAVSLVR